MKQNIDRKLKRSEAKEHRVNLIALEIKRWDILRYYKLHKMYGNLAESILKDIIAITQQTQDRPTIQTPDGRLTLYHMNKGWTLELLKNFQIWGKTEDIKELIWNLVDTADGVLFKHGLQRYFPKAPDTFYRTPENWSIQATSSYGDDDITITKTRKIAEHLGSMLLAYALQEKNLNHQVSSESIYDQVRSFVAFGDVIYNKSAKVNLNKLELPNPVVSIGDNLNSFVIRYSKFCNRCGSRLPTCYCETVSVVFNHKELALSDICWPCSEQMIKRALLHDFNDEFSKEACFNALEVFMEGYVEQAYNDAQNDNWGAEYGRWMDLERDEADGGFSISWKKIDLETYVALMDDVQDLYSEYWDGDPPEGTCNCPTWASVEG